MNNIQTFKQLLSKKEFIHLWSSQLLSQLTINLVNFSILTHIYGTTKSTVAVSLLWVSYSLPALLFGPFAGSIVDRFSLRHMMMATNFLQAITVLLYLLVGNNIFFMYSIVFLYSFLDQLYVPAQQASVPWLVEESLLTTANGIFLLTQQGSFLIGFGLGGIFLSLLGRPYTVVASSIFLALAAFSVYRLPHDKRALRHPDIHIDRFFDDFKAGYSYLQSSPQVFLPLGLIVFTQVFLTIISVLLPSYTNSVLGLDFNQAGITFIIPGAIGAIIFTIFLPRLLEHRRKKDIITLGLFLASFSLGLLSILNYVPIFRPALSAVIAIAFGISLAAILTPAQTWLQEVTSKEFRGRIFGVLGFMMTVTTALPLILVASLSDLIGVGAIIGLLAASLFASFLFVKYRGHYVLANSSRI